MVGTVQTSTREPGAETFRSILTEPNTTTGRASLWILLSAFVTSILSAIIGLMVETTSRNTVLTVICGLIAAPIFAVLGLYIATAIYHGVSRLFGSSGNFNQLFFCFAAIQAPETILGLVVYLFFPFLFSAVSSGRAAAIGIPTLCLAGFGLLFGLYSLVLFVMAVAGAENLTTGRAILTVLLPTVVVIVGFSCLGFALVAAVARQVH